MAPHPIEVVDSARGGRRCGATIVVMNSDDLAPLLPPTQMPAVRSDTDLHRTWRALVGALGFTDRRLWLLFLDGRARPCGPLLQIDDLPDGPWAASPDDLVDLCRDVLDGPGTCASVAMLLTRPGPGPWHLADRAWARFLTTVAERVGAGVDGRPWPVHRAHDVALERVDPDDLRGRVSA